MTKPPTFIKKSFSPPGTQEQQLEAVLSGELEQESAGAEKRVELPEAQLIMNL